MAGPPGLPDGEARSGPSGTDPDPVPELGGGGRLGAGLARRPGCRGGAGRAAAWPSPADDRSRGAEEGGAAAAERSAAARRERARRAGGCERAERGRGAAARPAAGPAPRGLGPLYGMWLVTFLLLLDSLHQGETLAGGAAEEAACGAARGRRPGGVPGWLWGSGDQPQGLARGGGAQPEPSKPPERARWGSARGRPAGHPRLRFRAGGVRGMLHEPGVSQLLARPQFCPRTRPRAVARLVRSVALGCPPRRGVLRP